IELSGLEVMAVDFQQCFRLVEAGILAHPEQVFQFLDQIRYRAAQLILQRNADRRRRKFAALLQKHESILQSDLDRLQQHGRGPVAEISGFYFHDVDVNLVFAAEIENTVRGEDSEKPRLVR